jgi:hypothetical protein
MLHLIAPCILWLAYATYVTVGTALRSPDSLFRKRRRRR